MFLSKTSKARIFYFSLRYNSTEDQSKKLRVPLSQKEGVWQSSLKLFESPLKSKRFLILKDFPELPKSISLENIKKWFQVNKFKKNIYTQAFVEDRHLILKNELAAAHFLVFRGASVKFIGENNWIKKDKKGMYDLPSKYIDSKIIEAIDSSNFNLIYEGFQNLKGLKAIKWLSLKNNIYLDDWCVDWISGEYARTLEYLDISDCPLLTERCVASLYKLNKLSTLVVNNTANSKNWKLSLLLLQDSKPTLSIEGVEFIRIKDTVN